ncbi:metal-dependent transcriptional regulator [Haloferax sp. KTX1]|uniref:metal-dependent transcriptional regulator n=1 Tax=Haloferax sp. KTX1 TaxID=2600597 RepID=UPI0011DD33E1|nr:metal-dependent transcriptional regulator [Haloferax sp. KTX1]
MVLPNVEDYLKTIYDLQDDDTQVAPSAIAAATGVKPPTVTILTERLGYDWSDVHDEADVLEHYVSEKLEARLEAVLGNPTVDPHGAPIPTGDLTVQRDSRRQSVTECKPGDLVVVSEVRDSSRAVLDYLAAAGVTLGTRLEVAEIAPFGMVTLDVTETGERFSLPTEPAMNVFVSQCDDYSVSKTGQFSEAP